MQISPSSANLGHVYNPVHPGQAEATLIETFEALSWPRTFCLDQDERKPLDIGRFVTLRDSYFGVLSY